MNKPLLIIGRTKPPHYEVHFDKYVEFWDLNGTDKLGESEILEVISWNDKK